jgi:hypothetical protein
MVESTGCGWVESLGYEAIRRGVDLSLEQATSVRVSKIDMKYKREWDMASSSELDPFFFYCTAKEGWKLDKGLTEG